jgi:hypothetical protein
VALRESITSRPTPVRVGASDIAQIRDVTQTCTSWSRAYGGGTALEAAMGELHWSAGLLEARCPDRLHPELHAAVGALAETVGYMALDAGAHTEVHGAEVHGTGPHSSCRLDPLPGVGDIRRGCS